MSDTGIIRGDKIRNPRFRDLMELVRNLEEDEIYEIRHSTPSDVGPCWMITVYSENTHVLLGLLNNKHKFEEVMRICFDDEKITDRGQVLINDILDGDLETYIWLSIDDYISGPKATEWWKETYYGRVVQNMLTSMFNRKIKLWKGNFKRW